MNRKEFLRAGERLAGYQRDPVAFVRGEFKAEPDEWQRDVLRLLPEPGVKRISMQACVGPGKSALLAWAGWWFMACFCGEGEHPQGAVVSVTKQNLSDNVWKEYAKWQQRSPFLQHSFTWTSERIFSNDFPSDWFLSARAWPKKAVAEEQGRTLSGLHAKFILCQIDESGDIPVAVLKAAEQAMSNCEWGCIMQAGNPISRDGMLYHAAVRDRENWNVISITGDPDDPKRSPRVSLEWAERWIAKYGRSDPWVMSHILGQYPHSAINALLSVEEVEEAMRRNPKHDDYAHAARVLGVDVAREGMDRSVIFPRQGLVAFEPQEFRGVNSVDGAGHVARKWTEWDAHACFVDDTGGFGAGWIDQLQTLGFAPVGVPFSGKATDRHYANKRAEMIFELAKWIKRGGSLPNMPELVAELTEPTYTFKGDALIIEPKESIRDKIGRSPDLLDALALTFAFPVLPPSSPAEEVFVRKPKKAIMDDDPYYRV